MNVRTMNLEFKPGWKTLVRDLHVDSIECISLILL